MSVIGYIYTGTGYQYVGVGKKVYDSTWAMRQFYDKVEKKYPDFKINKLSFLGPKEELMKEENGIIVMAAYQSGIFEVLKQQKINPEQISGFKSGELVAYCNSGGMVFEDLIYLLFKKIEFLKNEISKENFIHLLVNSVAVEKIEQVVSELKKQIIIEIISYNAKDSAIIICERKIKEKITDIFKKLNGTVLELPNEEFSNFSILKPVAEKLKKEFMNIKTDKPIHRLISQTTGTYYDTPVDIKEKIFDYIFKPLRLDLIITTMLKNAVNTFVEIGCGTFIGRYVRKADSGKRTLNTHDLAGLSTTVKLAN